MELSQVRYFLVLCRTLNFSRAADECHVTQPAFSRAIQRLEDELGGPLIHREGAATQLSDLGREMRPHFETMLGAAQAAQALAQARRSGAARPLRIGLGPGIAAAPVAPAVAEILRALPGTEILFTDGASSLLLEAMLADGLDCALLPDDPAFPERLNRWPLYAEGAVLVCPESHRLARLNQCEATHLADETLLLGEGAGDFGEALLRATGGAPQIRTQRVRASATQMQELVRAGLGVALLPARLGVAPALAARDFVAPALSRQIMLTALAGRPQHAAAAGFIRLCRVRDFN